MRATSLSNDPSADFPSLASRGPARCASLASGQGQLRRPCWANMAPRTARGPFFKHAMTGVTVQPEGMTELSPDSARRSGNENALLGQKRGQK